METQSISINQELEINATIKLNLANLIVSSPDICNGKPRLYGTRMTVQSIAIDYKQGMSPENIAQEYPHLSLGQIYTILAYYHLHQQEIDSDIQSYFDECQQWENEHSIGNI